MNTMQIDLSKRYTYADYLNWMDDVCRELIDGLVYAMSPRPVPVHQDISYNVCFELKKLITQYQGECRAYQDIDVLFADLHIDASEVRTVLSPDVSVFCDREKVKEAYAIAPPDLVVEILSKSTRKLDLTHKFNIYEKYGVREYWIVSPKLKSVTVYVLQDEGIYDDGEEYSIEDEIPVAIFGGVKIKSADIFKM